MSKRVTINDLQAPICAIPEGSFCATEILVFSSLVWTFRIVDTSLVQEILGWLRWSLYAVDGKSPVLEISWAVSKAKTSTGPVLSQSTSLTIKAKEAMEKLWEGLKTLDFGVHWPVFIASQPNCIVRWISNVISKLIWKVRMKLSLCWWSCTVLKAKCCFVAWNHKIIE